MTCLCELGPSCNRTVCFFAHHPDELWPGPEGLSPAANSSYIDSLCHSLHAAATPAVAAAAAAQFAGASAAGSSLRATTTSIPISQGLRAFGLRQLITTVKPIPTKPLPAKSDSSKLKCRAKPHKVGAPRPARGRHATGSRGGVCTEPWLLQLYSPPPYQQHLQQHRLKQLPPPPPPSPPQHHGQCDAWPVLGPAQAPPAAAPQLYLAELKAAVAKRVAGSSSSPRLAAARAAQHTQPLQQRRHITSGCRNPVAAAAADAAATAAMQRTAARSALLAAAAKAATAQQQPQQRNRFALLTTLLTPEPAPEVASDVMFPEWQLYRQQHQQRKRQPSQDDSELDALCDWIEGRAGCSFVTPFPKGPTSAASSCAHNNSCTHNNCSTPTVPAATFTARLLGGAVRCWARVRAWLRSAAAAAAATPATAAHRVRCVRPAEWRGQRRRGCPRRRLRRCRRQRHKQQQQRTWPVWLAATSGRAVAAACVAVKACGRQVCAALRAGWRTLLLVAQGVHLK